MRSHLRGHPKARRKRVQSVHPSDIFEEESQVIRGTSVFSMTKTRRYVVR